MTEDILVVLRLVAQEWAYPNSLGHEDDFQEILRQWRPRLFAGTSEAEA